jgi:arginyl-tRNA synthetase
LPDPVSRLARALSDIAGAPVALERPGDHAHGDYATNVALRIAPTVGRTPRELADGIAAAALAGGVVAGAEVAGPGFVNLRVSDVWIAEALGEVLEVGESFGARSATAQERIQVEMVSANPTGPLTVASARNAAYGDSVARLLVFAGHEVAREYYYNDAGAQMERFQASVEAARRGEEPPEDGYQGAYIAELAGISGDPVPAMLARIEATLERFRVHFDTWERESEFGAEVAAAVPLLDTYEEDGAVWARTSAHGDDKDRVLVRSNGEPTYFGKDAAYIRRKLAGGFDRLVYVLGADHHGYVARLQALAKMLGYSRESVEVLIYQLVHLAEGGEAKKMSKRRGDVVFLDDLLDTIGVDAARWYLVSRGHDQTIEIDVDLAKQKTQKNPVYYVRNPAELGARARKRRCGSSGARGARAREAAARVPDRRCRLSRAASAARCPELRDSCRGRLSPLLPPPPRARVGERRLSARSLRRGAENRRSLPRFDRRRRPGTDVTRRDARGSCDRRPGAVASPKAM